MAAAQFALPQAVEDLCAPEAFLARDSARVAPGAPLFARAGRDSAVAWHFKRADICLLASDGRTELRLGFPDAKARARTGRFRRFVAKYPPTKLVTAVMEQAILRPREGGVAEGRVRWTRTMPSSSRNIAEDDGDRRREREYERGGYRQSTALLSSIWRRILRDGDLGDGGCGLRCCSRGNRRLGRVHARGRSGGELLVRLRGGAGPVARHPGIRPGGRQRAGMGGEDRAPAAGRHLQLLLSPAPQARDPGHPARAAA